MGQLLCFFGTIFRRKTTCSLKTYTRDFRFPTENFTSPEPPKNFDKFVRKEFDKLRGKVPLFSWAASERGVGACWKNNEGQFRNFEGYRRYFCSHEFGSHFAANGGHYRFWKAIIEPTNEYKGLNLTGRPFAGIDGVGFGQLSKTLFENYRIREPFLGYWLQPPYFSVIPTSNWRQRSAPDLGLYPPVGGLNF